MASGIPTSQLRNFREAESELTKDEPGEDAESDVAKAVKDAVVLRLLRRRHDVNRRLGGRDAVVFGHDFPPYRI